MLSTNRTLGSFAALFLAVLAILCPTRSASQDPDEATVIHGISAAVGAREDNLLGYTAIEHYLVFRNGEQQQPAAEMRVKTTYRRDIGKSYEILSETGSTLLRKQLLERMLDNEKSLTRPATRRTALINSTNYTMTMKGKAIEDNRACVVMQIAPKRPSPYLFNGQIWVDARTYAIVRLEGITSKSPTVFAAPTQVSRQYEVVRGFPMATRATASTSIWLVGPTRIAIDYTDYDLQVAASSTSPPSAPKTAPSN